MSENYAQIAATITAYLAPFTPYLVESGKKFAGKAGEAAWEKAQTIWGEIKSRFGDDKKIETAAKTVSSDPQDEDFQGLFAEALAARLKDTPDFANELLNIIGGEDAVQKVLADRSSWVEDVTQEFSGGGGQQVVQARDDSVIKGVRQIVRD